MLFDSIKRNPVAIIVVCMAVLLLLWGTDWYFDAVVVTVPVEGMPLHHFLSYYLSGSPLLTVGLGALVTLLIGMYVYRLNEQHLFISKREQLLPIIFVLLASAFKDMRHLQDEHFAVFCIIAMFGYIFRTYRNDYAFKEVFYAALLLSVATLFYAPSVYFLLIYIISLRLMKSAGWRDCMVALAGLLTPYIIALFYYAIAEGEWQTPFLLLVNNLEITFHPHSPDYTIPEWICFGYVVLFVLVSIVRILFVPQASVKIKTIRINVIFIWAFVVACFCFIFYRSRQTNESLLFAALSAAVILANLFGRIKRDVQANAILFILVLLIVGMQVPVGWYTVAIDAVVGVWNFIAGLF